MLTNKVVKGFGRKKLRHAIKFFVHELQLSYMYQRCIADSEFPHLLNLYIEHEVNPMKSTPSLSLSLYLTFNGSPQTLHEQEDIFIMSTLELLQWQ